MKKEERLFAALSGVDEELLSRSEKRARPSSANRRWIAWGAALAACLALALLVPAILPSSLPVESPADSESNANTPNTPATPDIPVTPDTPSDPRLPFQPAGPERLHLLQLGVDQRQKIPAFTLWINEEIYYTYEQDGVYTVKPHAQPQVPDQELPTCKFEISFSNFSMPDVLESVRSQLGTLYESVIETDRNTADVTSGWPDTAAYNFRAGNGTDWDSAQREVWLIPCKEGVFLLTASFFLEAEEGHGIRFLDMARSFQVTDEDAEPPAWEPGLEDAVQRLTKAALSDDLSEVRDLLSEDMELLGGGEDVYAYVSISHIDYTLSDSGNASVSVQYRLGGEDAYDYLTMQLHWQDGWLADWIGFEK